MPADRDYLQEERADESEYGSLVGGPDAGHPESVDEAPGSWCSSGEVRRRVLALLLAVLLFFRWRAAAPPQSKFAQCHSIGPVLVGSHHKTGTVLLTHLLKDACDAMDWRCVFNHDRGHCASVAEARAPAAAPVADSRIEIDLAGGHRMRISGGYDPEALARLIRGLTA